MYKWGKELNYNIKPSSQDIEHRAHKYVDRKMGRNGKWIYYYTTKPSLKARTGRYAGEKLRNQQMKSAITIGNMTNNSREEAEAKQAQRNIEQKKIDKAQAEYDSTLRGKIEKTLSKGMDYLERLGIVTTNTTITTTGKTADEYMKSKKLINSRVTVNGKEVKSGSSKMSKEQADKLETQLIKSKMKNSSKEEFDEWKKKRR